MGERLPHSLQESRETVGKAHATRAYLTQDGLHVLVQIKIPTAQRSGGHRLLIFDTYDLERMLVSAKNTVSFLEAPQHVLDCINIPLGILPGFRLVFLEADLWLCTLDLNTVDQKDSITRRFFVPRDWATTACFELSCLLQNGTFVCPREADVAIINYCWENSLA